MKKLKRGLILLVAVAMIFSMIPSTSFAWAETENPTGTGDDSSSVFDVSGENETETVQVQPEEVQEEESPAVRTVSDGDVSITATLKRGCNAEKDGNHVWVPGWDGTQEGAGSDHGFQYELLWSIDSEKAGDYEPGSISVKIPKRILYHFDFDENGDPVMEDGKIKRVPDNTVCTLGISTNPGDTFTYREEGDYIIIYNQSIPTEQNFSCTVTYHTEKETFYYLDYDPSDLDYCGSDFVPVEYTTHARGEDVLVLTETAPRVFIDTSATLIDDYTGARTDNEKIYNTDYNHPFASRKTMDRHWAGGDGNNYMRFLIEVTFKSPVTQAYNLKVEDLPIDHLLSSNPCNLHVVGYRFETEKMDQNSGSITGYSDINEVHGLTVDKIYVYVLVAADAPPAGANNAKYNISNEENTYVESACGVDDDQHRYCKFGPWTWSFNVTVPQGKFMLYKWGNNNWEADAHTFAYGSKYPIANYDLDKFQEAMETEETELGDISFYYQWYGFGWAWTRSQKIADESVFGKKDVQWTFVDDEVYLEDTRLSQGDYYVDSVCLHVASHNRVWDPTAGVWGMSGQTQAETYANDKPFYLYVKINGNWVLAATAEWRGSENLNSGSIECDESIVTVTRGSWNADPGSPVSGYIFRFKEKNVTGFKFVNENRHYQHYAYTRATFALLSSEKVKNLVRDKQEVKFKNYSDMIVKEYNLTTGEWISTPVFQSSTNSQANPNRTATDFIVGERRSLQANKTALSGENNTTDKYYKTSWFMNAREHMDSGPRTPVQNELNNGLWIQQPSGVFYDLLPRGTTLIPDSVEVYSIYVDSYGPLSAALNYNPTSYSQYRLSPDQYTVVQIPNYKGERGYNLVKITINKESVASKKTLFYKEEGSSTTKTLTGYPGYTVKFDTATDWAVLDDYGSLLYNSVAFRTGNVDDIIQVGTTRDTSAGSALEGLPSGMEDKATVLGLMNNLEYAAGGNIPKIFTYAYGGHEAIYDTSSSSGLSKAVKGENDLVAVTETEVDPSGHYSYRLRYSAGSTSEVTNVLIYDNLETFNNASEGKITLWRGTPVGISFEVADDTNFNPVVYLSDEDVDFSQYNASNLPDLTASIWTKYEDPSLITEDIMKSVKSIAVDLGSYVIKPYKSVNVWVDMQAPSSNETDVKKPPTYNMMRASAVKNLVTAAEPTAPAPGMRADNTPDFTVSRETKVSYEIKGEVKIQKVDDTGRPIRDVSFSLTGTSKFGDDVNMTGTTDADGYVTFTDLDISGTEGYTLTETVPDGYISEGNTWTAIVNTDGSSTINGEDSSTGYYVITNREETSAYADKRWINADGSTNPPEGATIEFTLFADGEDTGLSVTLDGTAEIAAPTTAGGYESQPWKATFVHLPKYKQVDGQPVAIVYTVKETGYWTGYGPTSEDAIASGGVITNKPTLTQLSVIKAWKNADESTTAPDDAEVTFTLFADGENTGISVTLDGTVDTTVPTAAGGYESEAWKATFVNLPKYKNVNGVETEIKYTVEETGTWPGYVVTYGSGMADIVPTYAVDGGTITNTQESTYLTVTKAWENADGTTTAPDGAEVTFTLYADGTATEYTATLDGTAETTIPEGTAGFEAEPWMAAFIRLPKYKAVNGEAVEIQYTVVETGTWAGYEVIYEGEDAVSAIAGEVISNVQKVTGLSVTKAWKNADGSTTPPEGGKVTFTLLADGTATNYTVELDGTADTAITGTGGYESAAWKATFVNLPKYNGDDEIEYTVQETGTWPGYTVSYGDGTTATYAVDGGTITNTQVPTELSVTKAWKNADGSTTPPEGGKVTFTLLADGTATNYTVELDGTADTAITGTGGYESAAWKATFVNLPKYNGDDEIEYTVTETGTWPGYTVSYGDGTTATYAVDGGTITNTEVPTGLTVTKAWKNADGSTTPPAGGKVTFTLYADGTATNYTVELDGTADAAITGTGGYESAAWKATFVNLPKYNGDDEIEYTVTETGTWPGYTVSYGDGTTATYAVDGGTITNTQEPTGLTVIKAWKNADGSTTAPEGGKVTFTLYADGTATNYTVELDGTADTAITGTGGYESAAWKATFVNLPKYNGDDEIEYTVTETGTWPGYTVSYGDGTTATYAVDGGTITNTQVPTGLSVVKAWKNADGSTTPPEGGKVTFTLYADGTATNYTVELDGTADAAITGAGGYESAAWTATFVNLPKYNGDDEIEYTVTETGTWPGYIVSYGDGTTATYAVDGGTITNTQVPTELSVVKAWKNADGTTTPPEGGKVTFTLLADGTATNYTVELDGTPDTAITGAGGYESEAWKATFINLPKYDGNDEIEYTVTESGTWPGYTVSYGDGTTATYAVDGGTITNTQVPTELSVVKAWKNADGSTTAPEGGKVTFTLLADGTATNYTVELDGTPDTAITGTGGYESEAWKATFINLPKYKIENGKEAEIEYTVTETGTWPGYEVVYEGGETATYAVADGTITNKQITTEISGIKTWNDAEFFVDGVPVNGYQRPESITINLLADGTVIDSVTVTEDDDWEYEFTDLPKYRIADGQAVEIQYTVTEDTVAGYEGVVTGTDVDNTPVKDETIRPTQIILIKADELTWDESIEPIVPGQNVPDTGMAGAEFTLTAPDGTETVVTTGADGTVTMEFTEPGIYTLVETKAPEGYQNPGKTYTIDVVKSLIKVELVDDENAPGGKIWMWNYLLDAFAADFALTNDSMIVMDPPELIDIEGEKIWDDGNDIEGKRPKNITVELFADGEKIDEQVVTSANNWKFTFTDLPKMKDGKEIVYTIGEVPIKGYTTTIEGFKITNKHEVKTGDEMNLGLWIGIFAIAAAAIVIFAISKLLKKK